MEGKPIPSSCEKQTHNEASTSQNLESSHHEDTFVSQASSLQIPTSSLQGILRAAANNISISSPPLNEAGLEAMKMMMRQIPQYGQHDTFTAPMGSNASVFPQFYQPVCDGYTSGMLPFQPMSSQPQIHMYQIPSQTPSNAAASSPASPAASSTDSNGVQGKLKPSNIPASKLRIGEWVRTSFVTGDLVAKFYYAKKQVL